MHSRPHQLSVRWPGFVLALCWLAGACASGPHPRTQHVVDGELVSSSPPSPNEYAAYMRVRLAIETPNADLNAARADMRVLLGREPRDPHLWVTKAQLERKGGDDVEARKAANRALELAPDYAPATELIAALDGAAI